MKLTLHELSIGASLQRPISKHDILRRDDWMASHTDELFTLAREALIAREDRRKAAMRCDAMSSPPPGSMIRGIVHSLTGMCRCSRTRDVSDCIGYKIKLAEVTCDPVRMG